MENTEIDPDAPYQNYGLDSIIGINFVAQLSEHFHDVVSPMDLYRYPTINQLVEYIMQHYQPAMKSDSSHIVNFQDENKFIADIAHLSDEQVEQLIEAELRDMAAI